MLKIWLTWLQPSLGVLGVLLVLASPLYSLAAQKPSTVSRASKAAQSNGTELQLTGIAATPDLAVRQLAIGAMTQHSDRSNQLAAKSRQQSNRDALDSFLAPATSQVVATKTTKPKFVKRSVNSALARTVKTKTTAPVSGLFIGNSDVRVATRFSPNSTRAVQPIAASTEIGAPTPLSAMMAASKVVDPYPVVRPELMQKLAKTPALATAPVPQPLNPIAIMPSGMNKVQPMATTVPSIASKAPQAIKPSVTTKVTREVTHSLDPIAKIPSGFHQAVPNSLDPIASIPSGLQRLLGNNLNNDRPGTPVRVAKASVEKANPLRTNSLKANSLVALNQLIAPTTAPEIVSGATLKLATAQAYTSVPKFDIPGERLSTVTLAKPATAVVSAKRLQKPALVATVQRKSNYVTLMTARRLESNPKASWTLIGQRNNLGGLILGSQPQAALNSRIGLGPTTEVKTIGTARLSGIRQSPIN